MKYIELNEDITFRVSVGNLRIMTFGKFLPAGAANGHYFFQDLWAAREIFNREIRMHVDVGSRIDGFVAHILPFCKVKYVDIRNMNENIENFEFIQGSILNLPFPDSSLKSLSCLHVLEHIGLGRNGDKVDPLGHKKSADELVRVLAPDGVLFFSTPTGKQTLVFDAHRVFSPFTIQSLVGNLKLEQFHLIDDHGSGIKMNSTFEEAENCQYGCGLYVFRKIAI